MAGPGRPRKHRKALQTGMIGPLADRRASGRLETIAALTSRAGASQKGCFGKLGYRERQDRPASCQM
jgi:hypothetical protein